MSIERVAVEAATVILGEASTPRRVLNDLTLTLDRGNFVCLFGANGAGKTTLVRAIAGLVSLTAGKIRFERAGKSESTRIALLNQDYRSANFPWMRLVDNVALPMKLNGHAPHAARSRAHEVLLDMLPDVDPASFPYMLSGGQQQLVALARALAADAELLLADEALSALDVARSVAAMEKISGMWERNPIPTLWVSHNLDEGIFLSDAIALLDRERGQIARIIPNPLPRPRVAKMMGSAEHQELRRAVIDFFEASGGVKP